MALMQHCWADWRTLWQARALLHMMTRRELASRYAGSAAGILWAYAQPLLMVASYFLVFDVEFAMRMGDNAPASRMGTYLVVGSLPWLAFCDSVSRGATSLVEAGSLLQKNALPPVLLVARSVLASLVVFAPLMVVLALVYIPMRGLTWALLALPLLMMLQGVLTFVLAHTLAILAGAVRDVLQILAFALSVGVFLSPVLFPIALFPQPWRWVLFLNPMSALVMAYQSVLLQGTWPSADLWLVVAAWLLLLVWVLNGLIRRSKDYLVDWL